MGKTWKDSKFDFKGKKESKKEKQSKDGKRNLKTKFSNYQQEE